MIEVFEAFGWTLPYQEPFFLNIPYLSLLVSVKP